MIVNIKHLGVVQADEPVIASIVCAFHHKAMKEEDDGYPTLAREDYKIANDLARELARVG